MSTNKRLEQIGVHEINGGYVVHPTMNERIQAAHLALCSALAAAALSAKRLNNSIRQTGKEPIIGLDGEIKGYIND